MAEKITIAVDKAEYDQLIQDRARLDWLAGRILELTKTGNWFQLAYQSKSAGSFEETGMDLRAVISTAMGHPSQ